MLLENVRIILNKVSQPGNAGAVCRAMKNMGLSELRLAAPAPLDLEQIRTRAVHAMDIWENAGVYGSLADAAADCTVLIGATRRRGRRRKSVSMNPRALAAWLKERQGTAGIVFGNERTGLEDAELELCNFATHIPVSPGQPSLNLSHAVQIYAYELFLALETQNPVKGEWQAMNREEILRLAGSITGILADIGFYKITDSEKQNRFFRDIISRAGLTEREGRYFRDIIAKAARLGENNTRPQTGAD